MQTLKSVLHSNKAYRILGDRYETWSSGGCWILAQAVKNWIGSQAQMLAVGSDRNLVEHVVVKYKNKYIDYDGFHTEKELLEKMKHSERVPHPYLHPFDPTSAGEIECPADIVSKLTALLLDKHPPIGKYKEE